MLPSTGIQLKLLVGQNIPAQAPSSLIEAFRSLEVTNREDSPDGFQIIFSIGKSPSKLADLWEYPLLSTPVLKPYARMIIEVITGATSHILIDGIITNQQFRPSNDPGNSSVIITGEDVGRLMDRRNNPTLHKQQADKTIIEKIIKSYATFGINPDIPSDPKTPLTSEQPFENDRVPFQLDTDRGYLQNLARRYNYVFFIEPTSEVGKTKAYWGPRQIRGKTQCLLRFNMGAETNVTQINFGYNPLEAFVVRGSIQDRKTNESAPIASASTIDPQISLAREPALSINPKAVGTRQYHTSGDLTREQAMNQAQTESDRSTYQLVANGEVDTLRYGNILRARRVVTLGGVGAGFDGKYIVKSVTHRIVRGDYKQDFTLIREGTGSTIDRWSD